MMTTAALLLSLLPTGTCGHGLSPAILMSNQGEYAVVNQTRWVRDVSGYLNKVIETRRDQRRGSMNIERGSERSAYDSERVVLCYEYVSPSVDRAIEIAECYGTNNALL
jgi:hypothetical protein